MNHKQKVKIARGLFNQDKTMFQFDIHGNKRKKKGYGLFGSNLWQERKQAIAARVKNREIQAQYAAAARRKATGTIAG